MFQKKRIYLIGIIIFTLVIVADLAIYLMAPNPSFGGGSFRGEMPEGFEMPEGDEMPEGFEMPENGEMPEGFERPQGGEMPEGFEMPENGEMPEGGRGGMAPPGGSSGGFLGVISNAFWPILIVGVLGDAVCIFMLVRLSKKKESDEDDPQDDDNDGNRPRRDKSNTILAVVALVLVAAVIISNLSRGSSGSTMVANSSVVQDEVMVADITSSFLGSGTLQSSEAELVELPDGVRVTSFLVKNGETVNAGDVIAKVDKPSVLNAIYEIQELIKELDNEISEVQDNPIESTITAAADGRVKAIYAKEGRSVVNTMYNKDALMIISLGGSMSVEFTTKKTVKVGQTVSVRLEDDSKIEGKVQQVQNGEVVVTTTDEGPKHGSKVTVETKKGKVLGKGILEVSSALKVTGYTGTVDTIHVQVEEEIQAGDTLLTLEGAENQARYQELLRQREELTDMESKLAEIYQQGSIKAEKDGVVSQIDEESTVTQVASTTTTNYTVTRLSTSSASSYQLVRTTSTNTKPTIPTTPTVPEVSDGTYAGKITKVAYNALELSMSAADMTGTDIAELKKIDEKQFTITKTYSPDPSIPVYVYENGKKTASTIGAVKTGDKVFVYLVGGNITQIDYIAGMQEDTPSQGQKPDDGTVPGGQGEQPSDGTPGNQSEVPGDGTPDNQGGMPSDVTPGAQGDMPTQGTIPNGMMENSTEEEEAVYVVETTSFCAITPSDIMNVEINVDELDVLSLQIGQMAAVTLDAVPGQEFEGEVKKISPLGTSDDGGSTKYTVTMEIARTEQMLAGMNASIRIEVGKQEQVLTVPAAAVYEDGNRIYVYTGADQDTKELLQPVEVTTGASDGTNIEILSGLAEGEQVYYTYAESIVYRMN